MPNFTIRIGSYLINGPLLLLIIVAFFVVTFLFVSYMKGTNKKFARKIFKITKWQKKEIPETFQFVKEEFPEMASYINENSHIIERFQKHLRKNGMWDFSRLESIAENAPFVLTNILFNDVEVSITESADGAERALLLLHTIDMINGGPALNKKKLVWIPEDIEEFPDQGISSDEARLKSILQAAIIRLADEMDSETGQIDPDYELPDYVKTYVLEDAQYALGDLVSGGGVFHIEEKSRVLIIHSLLMCIKTALVVDTGRLEPMDVLYVRALICMLDKQLYDLTIYTLTN